jgi:hypothetical protein
MRLIRERRAARWRAGWRLTAGLFGLIGAAEISWVLLACALWYFETGGPRIVR